MELDKKDTKFELCNSFVLTDHLSVVQKTKAPKNLNACIQI